MMTGWNGNVTDLKAVQKILVENTNRYGQQSHQHARGRSVYQQAALENEPEETSDLLPGPPPGPQKVQIEQESIELVELINQLKWITEKLSTGIPENEIDESNATPQSNSSNFIPSYRETAEMVLNTSVNHSIEGLIVNKRNRVESDRYHFEFNNNGMELIIVDKWTCRSTRIFSTYPPNNTIEVGQLVIFMLMDGTRLILYSKEDGIIASVDIIKGNQRVHGIGKGTPDLFEHEGLFETRVTNDGFIQERILNKGDTIYAGGDGNDWFTAQGRLVWGKPGLSLNQYPVSYTMDLLSHKTNQDTLNFHQVEKSI